MKESQKFYQGMSENISEEISEYNLERIPIRTSNENVGGTPGEFQKEHMGESQKQVLKEYQGIV